MGGSFISFFTSILFVIVGAIDVLLISISFGIKQMDIKLRYNIFISVMTGICTFLAMLFGNVFSSFISPSIGNTVGALILFFLSGKVLSDSAKTKHPKTNLLEELKTNPEAIDRNQSGTTELFEIFLLGLLLSLNNVGLGFSASLAELNIMLVSVLSFLFSFIFLKIGFYIGKKCDSKLIQKHADTLSAFIMILLGFYILFS